MLQPGTRRIPRAAVAEARCIAVFPNVVQAGFIVGGQRGRGLISCRQRSGNFHNAPPAVYTLSAGSVGLQAGAAQRSVVLLFTTQQSVNAVLDSLVKMGSQVAVSAGPSGYDQPVDQAVPIVAYGITALPLAHVARLHDARGALSCGKMTTGAASYETATGPRPRLACA